MDYAVSTFDHRSSQGSKMKVTRHICNDCGGRMFIPLEEKTSGVIHGGFLTGAAVLICIYYGIKREMEPVIYGGILGLGAAAFSLWLYLNYRKWMKWAEEQGYSVDEMHADLKKAHEEKMRSRKTRSNTDSRIDSEGS
ncbi:uncharacterized protein METZ01_LOCUS326290 [marine metagenome]|uniref:Uncharacterized protein n=1 Tax=marine metagenome TaxID=408172 RepID=A0A382PJL7_9ZZZZ